MTMTLIKLVLLYSKHIQVSRARLGRHVGLAAFLSASDVTLQ